MAERSRRASRELPAWASAASSRDLPSAQGTPFAGRSDMTDLPSRARAFRLGEGLYSFSVGELDPAAGSGLGLPAVLVSIPVADAHDPVEIIASSPAAGDWIHGKRSVVVKAPRGGGIVVATLLGAHASSEPPIEVRRIDALATGGAPQGPSDLSDEAGGEAIPCEILLHIARQGDRNFAEPGWAGNRDQRLHIEAFSLRPLRGLPPEEIEYKAFGPNGLETSWIGGGKLCGTRGRGVPLTGFAVRLPRMHDRFEVAYQGAFFDSGVADPVRNGEPCRGAGVDEPFSAINIRIISR
jgi:hypothetical protein